MAAHLTTHRRGSWLEGLRTALSRLFSASTPASEPRREEAPTVEIDRPTLTDDAVEQASEDSFPASDPPSYTGTSIP